jgi:hypothetical protein
LFSPKPGVSRHSASSLSCHPIAITILSCSDGRCGLSPKGKIPNLHPLSPLLCPPPSLTLSTTSQQCLWAAQWTQASGGTWEWGCLPGSASLHAGPGIIALLTFLWCLHPVQEISQPTLRLLLDPSHWYHHSPSYSLLDYCHQHLPSSIDRATRVIFFFFCGTRV